MYTLELIGIIGLISFALFCFAMGIREIGRK